MIKKNQEKKERKEKRNTFVGIRPARFKDKTKYSRKGRTNTEG